MHKPTASSNLAAKFPDLALQWHPTKNGEAQPHQFLPRSNVKVWWRCPTDPAHEWEAVIASRHRAGCPSCHSEQRLVRLVDSGGKRVRQTLGDIPELFAQLVANDAERATVAKLYVGNTRKFTWRCEKCLQTWQNQLRKRAIDGQACPFCSNQQTHAGNSLQALHPELAAEWDHERNAAGGVAGGPATVNPGSHQHVWWRCAAGHGWRTEIRQRVTQLTGCPKCNPKVSKFEVRVACELEAVFGLKLQRGQRILGIEADILLPTVRVIVEVDGFPWHSPQHFPGTLERDRRKNALFQSEGYTVLRLREARLPAVENCTCVAYDDGDSLRACKAMVQVIAALSAVPEHLRARAAVYQQATDFAGDAAYRQLAATMHLPKPGGSLMDQHPDVAVEWSLHRNLPLTPELVTPASHHKAWWDCACGHSWKAEIQSRAKLKTGCPRCSGRVASPGKTLADLFPPVAKEWDVQGNDCAPDQVAAFSNRPYAWRCVHGHEWKASVQNRTRGGQGCPYCGHKRASPEWNLACAYPEVARFFDLAKNAPLLPMHILPKSGKAIWWRCTHGHEWSTSADRQTRYGPRCRTCHENAMGHD